MGLQRSGLRLDHDLFNARRIGTDRWDAGVGGAVLSLHWHRTCGGSGRKQRRYGVGYHRRTALCFRNGGAGPYSGGSGDACNGVHQAAEQDRRLLGWAGGDAPRRGNRHLFGRRQAIMDSCGWRGSWHGYGATPRYFHDPGGLVRIGRDERGGRSDLPIPCCRQLPGDPDRNLRRFRRL